jgi:hypothetical protein
LNNASLLSNFLHPIFATGDRVSLHHSFPKLRDRLKRAKGAQKPPPGRASANFIQLGATWHSIDNKRLSWFVGVAWTLAIFVHLSGVFDVK